MGSAFFCAQLILVNAAAAFGLKVAINGAAADAFNNRLLALKSLSGTSLSLLPESF
jgi:hypothetical protein